MAHVIEAGCLWLPVSVHSKFDMKLLQKHIDEAAAFVTQCESENKTILDVCGERGDLYFLLRTCLKHQFDNN